MAGQDAFRAMQHRIRADALETSDALSSLRSWKSSIQAKDEALRGRKAASPSTRNAVPSTASHGTGKAHSAGKARDPGATAADHTYDKGYAKWESFDADAAMLQAEADEGEAALQVSDSAGSTVVRSPADLASTALPASTIPVPRASRKTVLADGNGNAKLNPAEVERERGNERFKAGQFTRAVEAYTRALGYEPSLHLVRSNRAEAYLRLKEFSAAMQDASEALAGNPRHVKSLLRRARAALGLGRCRDALRDLTAACELAPDNKRVATELRKAREMRRAALQRAPRAPLLALAESQGSDASHLTARVTCNV